MKQCFDMKINNQNFIINCNYKVCVRILCVVHLCKVTELSHEYIDHLYICNYEMENKRFIVLKII